MDSAQSISGEQTNITSNVLIGKTEVHKPIIFAGLSSLLPTPTDCTHSPPPLFHTIHHSSCQLLLWWAQSCCWRNCILALSPPPPSHFSLYCGLAISEPFRPSSGWLYYLSASAMPLICQLRKKKPFNVPAIQLHLFELMLAKVSLNYYVFSTQWMVSSLNWVCSGLGVPFVISAWDLSVSQVRLAFSAGAWSANQSEDSRNQGSLSTLIFYAMQCTHTACSLWDLQMVIMTMQANTAWASRMLVVREEEWHSWENR